ncbi:MAG: SsrA-binding protein [Flavobacteriales bacterium]|jgi:SsrA-binding protein
MAKKGKNKSSSNTIALNRRARFDFHIDEKIEAGIELMGWEVKSIRKGNAQLTESYVIIQNDEAWILGCQIQPLPTASTHFVTEPTRTRKLLMHRRQIDKIKVMTQQKGHTVVATAMYWKAHLIKVEVGLARGKQQHDKRQTEKERDWSRDKQRVLSTNNR